MFDWCIILLICITQCAVQADRFAVDETLQPNAKGIDVVRAAVLKIQNSCIFLNDNGFLLRIALVESNFGADPNTFSSDAASGGKGIWQINQTGFDDTKLVNSSVLSSVKTKLGVDWSSATFTSDNMNVPLFSALAARLLLYRKPVAIPSGLTEQAAYWKKYYNTAAGAGTETGFINKVNRTKTCNTLGADLLFILNSSPLYPVFLGRMKQVVIKVAEKLLVGTNETKIAVLLSYSKYEEYNNFINFTSYSTVGDLTSAIYALRWRTADSTPVHVYSLKDVGKMFRSARQHDTGFPRFLTEAKLKTDAPETGQAAKYVNAFSWLDLYAVGMGYDINETVLQLAASDCSRVYRIHHVSAISALTDELYDIACRSSVALPPTESGTAGGFSKITGTLAPNTPRKALDTAVSPLTGRTYSLRVKSGRATLYASLTNENPSSAISDFSATAKPNEPGVIYISPSYLAGALSQRSNDLSSNSATNGTANSIVYLSIVPAEGSGSVVYQLDARDGDRRSLYLNSAMGRPLNFLWPGLAAVFIPILREF